MWNWRKKHKKEQDKDSGVTARQEGEKLVFETDKLTGEEQDQFYDELAQHSSIPKHHGLIENGYDARIVRDKTRCPRCQAETQQRYASFIYATDIAPRSMFAPAGYFCTQCPTVVVDQKFIRDGVDKGSYKYEGVLGIEKSDGKEDSFFKTWNGEEPIYIMDEDQIPHGITTRSQFEAEERAFQHRSKSEIEKAKRKRKQAKQARKRNKKNR